jgi:hypothetical protein
VGPCEPGPDDAEQMKPFDGVAGAGPESTRAVTQGRGSLDATTRLQNACASALLGDIEDDGLGAAPADLDDVQDRLDDLARRAGTTRQPRNPARFGSEVPNSVVVRRSTIVLHPRRGTLDAVRDHYLSC